MQYKCQECNDTGSRDKLGTYLDCNACGTAATRRDLNDFVKSLGPTHPEDVALAIHQRALAMAPNQEAPACTECDGRGFTYWGEGNPGNGFDVAPEPPEQECCQLCGGSGIVPPDSELIVAAPAAANGALTDEQIDAAWDSLPGANIIQGQNSMNWNSLIRRAFARAILAAAGPDAALIKALEKIIEMNVQYCIDKYGDASKAETMGCVTTARAALSGAKGN